jgi:hypothetical protein
VRLWTILWPSKAVPWAAREASKALFGNPLGFILVFSSRSAWSSRKQGFCRKPNIPLVISTISRVLAARNRHLGETLNFRPLGCTSSHLRRAPVPFFRLAVASKKHLIAKPIKNQWKINVFGLFRAGIGCSRGPPWGPLGLPWDSQGGFQSGTWTLHLPLGSTLGGFWGHLEPPRAS